MIQIAKSSTFSKASEWYQNIYHDLYPIYKEKVIAHEATIQLLEHFLNYTRSKHIANDELTPSPIQIKQLSDAIEQIKEKKTPVAYILGYTYFMGHQIAVNQHTLIPRRETEEMTASIIQKHRHTTKLKILDLCTGSGCIAIALAKAIIESDVTAIDIDSDAIHLAQCTSNQLDLKINWHVGDLLSPHSFCSNQNWDIIVSNPPYIPQKYLSTLDQSVLAHEPHRALFVPNQDPLCFYRNILHIATDHLKVGGAIYTEIESRNWKETKSLFDQDQYEEIEVHIDMQGKKRWISAKKKERQEPQGQ